MNDLMSAGVHRIWKANMIAWLNPQPGETLIDVAGGTGDVARAFQKQASEVARRRNVEAETFTVVSDINEAMLVAGIKPTDRNMPRVACDAALLPFPDRSADAVTISFGIRNVVEIDKALREFRRVLKPGGRFACLEFSHMTHRVLQDAYDAYSFKVIPALGELVTGDSASTSTSSNRSAVSRTRKISPRASAPPGFPGSATRTIPAASPALHTGWAV